MYDALDYMTWSDEDLRERLEEHLMLRSAEREVGCHLMADYHTEQIRKIVREQKSRRHG